jgi:FKBP12-rapamycin complex-associated protein
MTNDDMLIEIMKNYEHAWTYDESNCKAWNAYAVLNYDAVNYFKNIQQEILDPSNENSRKLTPKMIDYTISAVKGLLKSIILSKAKYCLQNTLRLLTIWFEYGQHREVYDVLSEGIRTVPIEVWLQVLPQLIARIDSLVHQLIYHLLIDIGRQHPQALIYSLVVASKSVVRERKIAANRVLNNMREHSHTLVQQAMVVSEELIRISILWHEKWHEGLEEASRQYFGERSIPGKYSYTGWSRSHSTIFDYK